MKSLKQNCEIFRGEIFEPKFLEKQPWRNPLRNSETIGKQQDESLVKSLVKSVEEFLDISGGVIERFQKNLAYFLEFIL